MEWEYVTEQGDTWDVLAADIYGSEKLVGLLQEANPDYLGILYFPAGVILTIPDTPKQASSALDSPWKRNA
ncbi:tail protein X [Budviciaceae bacterium CWB-B4]|uniref:Tail protein X n=1 Tax=Limnobaculum xujianqingii TaxID=2738837 RepID=A0A9D7AII3_9GAMM|nr:tail protein X [Limnobaculum xujianqingii]MBK5073223.1 tail protein X [Limnobaculum xujianqingii]MBK5176532.1 tail protein X [Limnobaculum xujianqingii]